MDSIITSTTESSSKYKSQYSPFDKFINVLDSPETKRIYAKHLSYFLKFCNLNDYTKLVTSLSESEKYDLIADYLLYIRNEKKWSGSGINIAYSAIKRFYKVNRITINWEYLEQYKGKNPGKVVEDRLYETAEIKQLMDHADLRERVVILTLLSTGMRVGGLAGIRLKDIEYLEKYQIYKFKVYSDELKDKYITYCSPEAATTIRKYLDSREKEGDNLKPSSPLIYRKLARFDLKKGQVIVTKNQFDQPIESKSVQQIVSRLQHKSHVLSSLEQEQRDQQQQERESTTTEEGEKKKKRYQVMRCHGFRKMFNTICIKNNVNHSIKEKLIGHKKNQELDYSYFRPSEQQLLEEYLKVIDDLTVNEENRLSKKIIELQNQNQSKDDVIKSRLQKMVNQNKLLEEEIEKLKISKDIDIIYLDDVPKIMRILTYIGKRLGPDAEKYINKFADCRLAPCTERNTEKNNKLTKELREMEHKFYESRQEQKTK